MVLAARPYSYDLGEPTTTPTNIRQKVNLGDAMGDMKFAGSNPYLDANKQALIHSARNLWGSHQEPQAYMGFANGQSAGHGIRSIGPTSDGSFDGSHFLGHEDGLSSYLGHGDDNQRTEDEKLLAMLSDMAKGAADDDSDVMSLLPVEVQEDDPIVRSLLAQCGSMWEEVHAEAEVKNELQSRLRRELRQLQERSERQYQESTVFMQRLASAKQTLADKLKESSLANQELRARINSEWRQNERLRCTISEGVKSLTARAAELSAQIWELQALNRYVKWARATFFIRLNLDQTSSGWDAVIHNDGDEEALLAQVQALVPRINALVENPSLSQHKALPDHAGINFPKKGDIPSGAVAAFGLRPPSVPSLVKPQQAEAGGLCL
ncbi:unnamed protein product [Polarella glacialis]|uniref:Uncharacterized protein n=1 Tax=Polarella glacialis TaxID=89957 RepID=A0A813HM94_POLGL|nr:unnamed protein product [Polarella glacialis]